MDKAITSVMEETRKFHPTAEFSNKAHIKCIVEYKEIYRCSVVRWKTRRAEKLFP